MSKFSLSKGTRWSREFDYVLTIIVAIEEIIVLIVIIRTTLAIIPWSAVGALAGRASITALARVSVRSTGITLRLFAVSVVIQVHGAVSKIAAALVGENCTQVVRTTSTSAIASLKRDGDTIFSVRSKRRIIDFGNEFLLVIAVRIDHVEENLLAVVSSRSES
jgi:hypothetical protein